MHSIRAIADVSLAAAGYGLAAAGGGRGIVTTANIDFAMVPEGLQRGTPVAFGYRYLA